MERYYPGSFVCRGLFVHGDVKIDTTDNADGASEVTADAMKAITSTHATFIEWFKVKPRGDGAYRLTLLPSSIQFPGNMGGILYIRRDSGEAGRTQCGLPASKEDALRVFPKI
jgi:hypothetical protein